MTSTQGHLPTKPRYFGGTETESERGFYEALESAKDLIPVEMYGAISDGAGDRVCEAFDYGVALGAGRLSPDDPYGMGMNTDQMIDIVSGSLNRIAALLQQIREMS